MSPEIKEPGSQKQKVMIVIVIIVILIVIWQVLAIKNNGNSTPTITAASSPAMSPAAATKPMTANKNAIPQMTPQAMPANVPLMQQTQLNQPRPAPVQPNSELMKLQQESQTDYIASINKLQMLKIQREIDETKTAIATAELNRMTAEKNIADLITSKEGVVDLSPPPVGPISNTQQALAPMLPVVVHSQPSYSVLSVSYQGNKWTAVLGNNGKTLTVSVGDVLDDGSTIMEINRNTVTLKKDDKVKTLTIASSM